MKTKKSDRSSDKKEGAAVPHLRLHKSKGGPVQERASVALRRKLTELAPVRSPYDDVGKFVEWDETAFQHLDMLDQVYLLRRYVQPYQVDEVVLKGTPGFRQEQYYKLSDSNTRHVQLADGCDTFHKSFFVSA